MPTFSIRRNETNSRSLRATKAGRIKQIQRRAQLERLEERTLLTATLDVDPITKALVYVDATPPTSNNLTVSTTGALGSYTFTDLSDTITLTAGAIGLGWTVDNTSGHGVATGPDSSVTSIQIVANGPASSVALQSVDANTTIQSTVGAAQTVTLGDSSGVQNIKASVSVSNSSGSTALIIDDSLDTTARTGVQIGANQVVGLAPQPIIFSPAQLSTLTINGGTGGNTYLISGTQVAGGTFLNTGATLNQNGNTVQVDATSAPLTINDQAPDSITIGQAGSLAGVAGPVTISGSPSDLTVDDTADATGQNLTVSGTSTSSTLTGIPGVGTITYNPTNLNSLNINAGTGTNVLNVLFDTGNPVPLGQALPSGNTPGSLLFSPGLNFNGGIGANTLNLSGAGADFTNEVYSANGPGFGTITFDNSSNIGFTGLKPINDTVPVANYTFQANGSQNAVDLVNGPVFPNPGGVQTATISDASGSNPPAFELVNFGNKTNVSLNLSTFSSIDSQINVNNSTPAAGLATLALVTGSGNDVINLFSTPDGVSVSTTTASGNDTINVNAATLGGALTVNGGPGGGDVLNVDASGQSITGSPASGAIAFSPATATIAYSFIETINIYHINDQALTAGPAASIASLLNVGVDNVVVGSFTDADPNARAGDFVASIDWGDGTPATPGIVVANGVNGFSVLGSHEYTSLGNHNIATTVTDQGSHGTVQSSGLTVNTSDSGGQTVTLNATATTTIAGIAINPVPNVTTAIEGKPLTAIQVATFTASNPTAVVGGFTATIDWGDGSPQSAGVITQPGGVGTQFIISGTHTYAEESATSLPIIVTVFDAAGNRNSTTTTVTSVADAPLTAAAGIAVAAQEGLALANVPVATFTDTNPLATVSDFTAIITWGDGSTSSGTIVLVGGNATGAIFHVLGNHTYADEGVNPISVAITDVGGQTATANGASATVADAPLSSQGASIQGVEGITTGNVVLGTFSTPDPGALISDFTSGAGSIVVNWGDGSAPVTLTAANVTTSGAVNGVVFTITAAHTYAEEKSYQILITVTDDGGATTIIHAEADVTDAALTQSAIQPVVNFTEGVLLTTQVASFDDANPAAPLSDFQAVIDWGDGTPTQLGTISQPGGVGTAFIVSGSHTYADAGVNGGIGTYPIIVHIVDQGLSRVTLNNTANVADVLVPLSGKLNPGSDSGISNADAITNVKQPIFFGNTEASAHVTLYATPTGGVPFPIGQTTALADGTWMIMSNVALTDGTYTITATVVDQFGHTTGTIPPAPVVITPTLVIDTTGPKVTNVFFDRLNGAVDVTYSDNLSGIVDSTIIDAANYSFSKVHLQKQKGLLYRANIITINPGGNALNEAVAVYLKNGKSIRGGFYNFVIHSANPTLISGVQDVAGNALDGEFYGFFPSGNNVNGGDFQARLDAIHHLILAPQTVVGISTPVKPPGTVPGSVYITNHGHGYTPATPPLKTYGHVTQTKATAKATVKAAHATHDAALAHITVPKPSNRRVR